MEYANYFDSHYCSNLSKRMTHFDLITPHHPQPSNTQKTCTKPQNPLGKYTKQHSNTRKSTTDIRKYFQKSKSRITRHSRSGVRSRLNTSGEYGLPCERSRYRTDTQNAKML